MLVVILVVILVVVFVALDVGPAVAAEQLAAASRAPFHVAAEVVEATGADAAVVTSQGEVALRAGWTVAEAFEALTCELDEPSAAGGGEEHLPVAVFAHHHGASMTPGCDAHR